MGQLPAVLYYFGQNELLVAILRRETIKYFMEFFFFLTIKYINICKVPKHCLLLYD